MPRPRPDSTVADGVFLGTVVCDTREQHSYSFEGLLCDQVDGGGPLTIPTVRATLHSGDYSLQGYEYRVAVERKSMADLYSTIGQDRERFEAELQRLVLYDFAAVVIEATWPEVCCDPPPFTKLPPKAVFRSILAWQVRYGIPFLACGPRRLAEVTTFRLLERFLKEELRRGKDQRPDHSDPARPLRPGRRDGGG